MKKRYTIVLLLFLGSSIFLTGCFGGVTTEDINMQIVDSYMPADMDFNSNNIELAVKLKNLGGEGKFYLNFYIDKNQSDPNLSEEIVKAAESKIYPVGEDYENTIKFDVPTDYGLPTGKIKKIEVYSIGKGVTDTYQNNITLQQYNQIVK